PKHVGRNHHIDAYSMWLAGAGIKKGLIHGETDEFGYAPTSGRVHVHDLPATILHLLGLDHTKLTYRFQGRDFRLTDGSGGGGRGAGGRSGGGCGGGGRRGGAGSEHAAPASASLPQALAGAACSGEERSPEARG